MNNIKKYLFILLLAGLKTAQAQTPVNAGFETWSNLIFFYEPQGFVTTNYASVILGTGGLPTPNVSRSTQIKRSGTYAAKLLSYGASPSDSIGVPGAMVTGALDLINLNITPGFAYSGRPSEMRVWTQYSPSTLLPDSGIVSIAFTKYDPIAGPLNVVGAGFGVITPSSSFQEMIIPIFYIGNETPDTAIIVISTSSSFSFDTTDFINAPVGSTLYVDDMSFFGQATGVEKIEDLLQAQVYPNPTQGNFKMQFMLEKPSNVQLTVLDAVGKVLLQESDFYEAGLREVSLEQNKLATGIYFIELSNGVSTARKKLVVE